MAWARKLCRLLRRMGERGASTIEFGIVGTAYMLMLVAAFEMGYMVFIQSVLDNSARAAAREIRTGQVSTSTSFDTLLCSMIGTLIPCASVLYKVQNYASWTAAQTGVNTALTRDANGKLTSTGYNAGAAGDIVVIQVTYNYPFFTPWMGTVLGNGTNSAFLVSTVVLQSEPY